jgi:hypothetical protein
MNKVHITEEIRFVREVTLTNDKKKIYKELLDKYPDKTNRYVKLKKDTVIFGMDGKFKDGIKVDKYEECLKPFDGKRQIKYFPDHVLKFITNSASLFKEENEFTFYKLISSLFNEYSWSRIINHEKYGKVELSSITVTSESINFDKSGYNSNKISSNVLFSLQLKTEHDICGFEPLSYVTNDSNIKDNDMVEIQEDEKLLIDDLFEEINNKFRLFYEEEKQKSNDLEKLLNEFSNNLDLEEGDEVY